MSQTPSPARIKFAKEHGYKYVGGGWFRPVHTFAFMSDCRTVNSMTVHERINLRFNFALTCDKFNVMVMHWFRLRLNRQDIYTPDFFAFPYSNSVTFSPVK